MSYVRELHIQQQKPVGSNRVETHPTRGRPAYCRRNYAQSASMNVYASETCVAVTTVTDDRARVVQ